MSVLLKKCIEQCKFSVDIMCEWNCVSQAVVKSSCFSMLSVVGGFQDWGIGKGEVYRMVSHDH